MTASECKYTAVCQNTKNCFRCFNYSFLKTPVEKDLKQRTKKLQKSLNAARDTTGRQLEHEVMAELSLPPEAVVKPGSGNQWHNPGDGAWGQLLIDTKERQPYDAKGRKQLTVQKEWLDKILEEAEFERRIGCVVYRHREDDEKYAILRLRDLHSLIYDLLSTND